MYGTLTLQISALQYSTSRKVGNSVKATLLHLLGVMQHMQSSS